MPRVAALGTPLSTASASTLIVAFVVTSTVTIAIAVFGGGVAVGLHCGGCLGVLSIGGVVLLLEELGEQGDLIGDGVGGAGWSRGIVELAYAVGAGEFF